MISYSYTKTIIPDKLQDEIIVELSDIHHIDTVGDEVEIYFNEELSLEQKDTLDAIVAAHSISPNINIVVKNRILAAMEFGKNIMAEYGASNILVGKSLEQIQDIMTRTAKLQAALATGSLYVAISELDALEPDGEIITEAEITICRNRIQTYLGIPLT